MIAPLIPLAFQNDVISGSSDDIKDPTMIEDSIHNTPHWNDGAIVYKRMLTIWKWQTQLQPSGLIRTSPPLLGPIDLAISQGCKKITSFFSKISDTKERLVCVSKCESSVGNGSTAHYTHQLSNTRAGVRNNNGDTWTVHIVNAATVRQVNLSPLEIQRRHRL